MQLAIQYSGPKFRTSNKGSKSAYCVALWEPMGVKTAEKIFFFYLKKQVVSDSISQIKLARE